MYEAKLYKVDSKGKVRFWRIEAGNLCDIIGRDVYGYTVYHGVEGSPNIVSSSTAVTGKNIGKKNETTPAEQADLEAESLVKKQIDKNYTHSLDQAQNEDVGLLPMLAQSYKDHAAKIKFPAYIQPKYDGIRCLAVIRDGDITLISRKGKEFKAVGHLKNKITEALGYPIIAGCPAISDDLTVILDGELYSHNMTFQEIISATKRDTPSDKSGDIDYNIYDIVLDEHYEDRFKTLQKMITPNSSIKLAPTHEVNSVEDILTHNTNNLRSGYEGSMIRNKLGHYEPDKRSYNLQKFKQFVDEEFEIIGAEQNKGNQVDQCSFICKVDNGGTFKVKMMGDAATREEYWTNHKDYIGKMVNVRFFEWTDSIPEVPRFPIGVYIREDI